MGADSSCNRAAEKKLRRKSRPAVAARQGSDHGGERSKKKDDERRCCSAKGRFPLADRSGVEKGGDACRPTDEREDLGVGESSARAAAGVGDAGSQFGDGV